MPLVTIKYRPEAPISIDNLHNPAFMIGLRECVARALTVPGSVDCQLTANDVLIELKPLEDGDINFPDICFLIFAGNHPERVRSRDTRCQAIVQFVRQVLTDKNVRPEGFVWLLLVEDSFVIF